MRLAMGKKGRPTKLTKERQELICSAIRAGNTLATAAAVAGVSRESVRQWRVRGAKERRGAKSGFGAFLGAISKARADGEAFHVANIHRVARGAPPSERRTETT